MTGAPPAPGAVPGPDDLFVGRAGVLQALSEVPPEEGALIVDLHGALGAGKTTLLRHARRRLPEVRPTAVLSIAVGATDAPEADAAGRSADEVTRAYRRFREVLSKLVKSVLKIEQQAGRHVGDATRRMRPVQDALARSGGSLATGATGAVRLELSQGELAQAFEECYGEVLGGRPALVTIDNFEHVAQGALGEWLLDLARRLPRAVTVVARTPGVPALQDRPGAPVFPCPLEPLAPAEIREWLEACLPGAVTDELVEMVTLSSDGHPRDVKLAVDVVRERGATVPRAVVEERLSRPVPARLEPLMERCCVLHSFDVGLLEAVLGPEQGRGQDVIAELRDNLLVEEDEADPRPGFFRLDGGARTEFDDRLAQLDPARWRAANRLAADHIDSWLQGYEEGAGEADGEEGERVADGGAYGDWYRYEKPEWRAALRDWLHYEARAAGTELERRRSRARFARHFLDGFYWWGCYIPFPFISDLLDDWERTQVDPALTAELRAFLDAYPTGYRKDGAPPEAWDTVLRTLDNASRLCGLPLSARKLAPDERHVGALIETFVAHALRYRAPAGEDDRAARYEQAARSYDTAVELFRQEGDDGEWNVAWALFERAELHAEHGGDRAREDWREAAALAPGLGDDELAANLHRLAADVRWPEAPSDAFAAHGRAVLHAYLLQGRYGDTQYRPDAYTLAFYREQVERATGRLVEHARAGGDLPQAVAALRAPFPWAGPADGDEIARRCAEGDGPALEGLLPEPPGEDDLNREGSPFLERWRMHYRQLGDPAATAEESMW